MVDESVIILGIDLESRQDIIEKLNDVSDGETSLSNRLYDQKIIALGLNEDYWALGIIVSSNYDDYVKKIDLNELKNYQDKTKEFIQKLKNIDDILFLDILEEDVKLFHTINYV